MLARKDGYACAAAIALVPADGVPACGESAGVVGVDTGLASIGTRSGLEAIGSDPHTALDFLADHKGEWIDTPPCANV